MTMLEHNLTAWDDYGKHYWADFDVGPKCGPFRTHEDAVEDARRATCKPELYLFWGCPDRFRTASRPNTFWENVSIGFSWDASFERSLKWSGMLALVALLALPFVADKQNPTRTYFLFALVGTPVAVIVIFGTWALYLDRLAAKRKAAYEKQWVKVRPAPLDYRGGSGSDQAGTTSPSCNQSFRLR